MTEKKEILANAELIERTLCNTDTLQEEKRRLESEMAVLMDMAQNCIAENARIAQEQTEYQKRYFFYFRKQESHTCLENI